MTDQADAAAAVKDAKQTGQLLGAGGVILVLVLALAAWGVTGGHLVLTKPGPNGGPIDAEIYKIF